MFVLRETSDLHGLFFLSSFLITQKVRKKCFFGQNLVPQKEHETDFIQEKKNKNQSISSLLEFN